MKKCLTIQVELEDDTQVALARVVVDHSPMGREFHTISAVVDDPTTGETWLRINRQGNVREVVLGTGCRIVGLSIK